MPGKPGQGPMAGHPRRAEPTSIILLNGHGTSESLSVVSLLFLDVSPDMSIAPKPHQRRIFLQWMVGGQHRSTQLAKAREKDTKCSATDRVYITPCRNRHRREGRGRESLSRQDQSQQCLLTMTGPSTSMSSVLSRTGSGLSCSGFGGSILGSVLSQFPKEELRIIWETWNKMF